MTVFPALKQSIYLVFFKKVDETAFTAHKDTTAGLLLIELALFLFLDYIQMLPTPIFNSYAIASHAYGVLASLIVAYLLCFIISTEKFLFIVAFLAGASIVISVITETLYSIFLTPQTPQNTLTYISWGVIAWWYIALIRITLIVSPVPQRLKTLLIGISSYTLIAVLPGIYFSNLLGPFWYQDYDDNAQASNVVDPYAEFKNIDVEKTFYAQPNLVEAELNELKAERENEPELFFVGFGSYAAQRVFEREIHYIKALFEQRFDAKGHTVALINQRDTVNSKPLANLSNLSTVLNRVGQTMDIQNDVLFLYLTSHGSKDHKLSVNFWPIPLNHITPEDLRHTLDQSGIKNRVLVISACYSGGFIDALKDDNTFIATAAAFDKTSFGCNDANQFTYFGATFFKQQLTSTFSFKTAFEGAKASIDIVEKFEQRKPSEPQLFIGKNILAKLAPIEKKLNDQVEQQVNDWLLNFARHE
ncbi:MAG: hypothetical protein HOM11_09605 [Methylococcales bacterium]|nr:hypothetical protein [Methylococcales bacterium]MBT7442537.1 hypothetical protein [Methylococcales bacterium]